MRGTLFCRLETCGIGGMAGGMLFWSTAGSGGTAGGGPMSFGKLATKPSFDGAVLLAERCSSAGNACGTARLSSAKYTKCIA